MQNFLKSILPNKGVMFLAVPNTNGKGFRHIPFDSLDDMHKEALRLDALEQTVYFACASYRFSSYKDTDGSTKYRTKENAECAKAFWLDIDCGETKANSGDGYSNKKEALNALGSFCSAIGLNLPTIVDSGGGVHAYFILDKAIEKAVWNETAFKLKSLTHSLNFMVDDSRTTDIASILRPVGTHNRKQGREVKLVKLKHESAAMHWEKFKGAIDSAYDKHCIHSVNTRRDSFDLTSGVPENPINIEQVKLALSHIDPNCDRAKWRNVCFAIHALEWSCSKDLALQWSRGDYL